MTENEIGTRVIEAAIAVHRELGPGLLETGDDAGLARKALELACSARLGGESPLTTFR